MGIALVNREPLSEPHKEEIAKRDSIIALKTDSLNQSQLIIDSLNHRIKEIAEVSDILSESLDRSEKELKTVKGSLKKLSNDELVTVANKAYGGSDTTKLEILLSRPTTEFLVESVKKVEILSSSLEFSKKLNQTYRDRIQLDSAVIDQHVKDKETLKDIVELRTEQLYIETEAYNRVSKKLKREKTLKKIIIGVAGGLLIYSTIK